MKLSKPLTKIELSEKEVKAAIKEYLRKVTPPIKGDAHVTCYAEDMGMEVNILNMFVMVEDE